MGAEMAFADLFCGAGGLALGFKMAGFKSVFALDSDKASTATYEANFGHHVFWGPIEKLGRIPVAVDVIIGGPPCQGFSPLGKMSPAENHVKLNRLWEQYLRLLATSNPKVFVVENVPEFLKSREFIEFRRSVAALGYAVAYDKLRADKFGVPQRRKRGLIIGSRVGAPSLPSPTGESSTVHDAISDLPREPDGRNWHIGRRPTQKSLERYACIPPGGNRFDLIRKRPDLTPPCWLKKKTGSTDVFGRLRWDEPSLTIRTEFYKPEKGRYLHPEAARPLTHREAARLQTFPDDFEFIGSRIEVAKMIGNAVPPKLAYHVAMRIRSLLKAASQQEPLVNSEAWEPGPLSAWGVHTPVG